VECVTHATRQLAAFGNIFNFDSFFEFFFSFDPLGRTLSYPIKIYAFLPATFGLSADLLSWSLWLNYGYY
jgi:hypothetical protein